MQKLLISFSFICLSTSALAQEELPPVVVTADRIATPLAQTGSAVTVITGEEMARKGISHVYDALKFAPGVSVSRNGGVGGASTIRLRGSSSGQVKVLLDGVPLNDPSNVDGSFDFNSLDTANIERIEIVRGPQSTLYGSDAIGGVVNIITRKGTGKPEHSAFMEAGNYHSLRAGASSRGAVGAWDYSLSAIHGQTKGFSHSSAGKEKDGAENQSLRGRLGYEFSDVFSMDASGGYARVYSGFDPSTTVDGPAWLEKQVMDGRLAGTWLAAGGDWENTLALEVADTHRSFDEPVGFFRYSTFDGTTAAAEYQSTLHLRERDALVMGLRTENQRAVTTSTTGGVTSGDLAANITDNALFGQYVLGLGEDTTLTAGGRVNDHELFGTQATYRLTAARDIPAWDMRLHASVGTGFKAPTLYQLYSAFGNTALEPEKSTGYDAGIERYWWDDRLRVSATAFYNELDNLIDFDFLTNGYVNVAEARSYGLESEVALDVSEHWSLGASHTYLMAEDAETDRVLPRRPKHMLTLSAMHHFTQGAELGADLRYVSRQLDSTFSPDYTKAYTTVDIYGSLPLDERWEAYGRIDNLLDRDYQEALGFNAAGITAYGGLRVRF